MDKYGQVLINNASKLDAITDACGEITKLATVIVEEHSRSATIAFAQKKYQKLLIIRNIKKIEVKHAAQVD
mgnify:CR=1 FL=1